MAMLAPHVRAVRPRQDLDVGRAQGRGITLPHTVQVRRASLSKNAA
jgi:hypothetical protein